MEILQTVLGSAVRHGLSAFGAFLIAKGVATTDQTTVITNSADVIIGLVSVLGSIGWSYVRTHFLTKKS
jgi:hypothetical protein